MNKLVSVCMIVKNEENVIEKCLSSLKYIADEIILIDTGSTDRTKEIASNYTDLIYDFEWINDFSAARNEGIRRATSKWILVVDADEYFPPSEALKFRDFIEKETPKKGIVYAMSIVSFLGESQDKSSSLSTGEVARLFPNFNNIFYTRPIHEQLCCLDGTPLSYSLAQGSLFHTGYLKEVIEARDKLNRNANIFTELKKKTGFSAYDLYTIGNEKNMQGDYKSSIYYYERSLKKAEGNKSVSWYPRVIISLTQTYLLQNRIHDAWSLIESKLIEWSHYPDYHALKSSILFHLGLYEQAESEYIQTYQAAEKLAETTQVFWLDNPGFASSIPFQGLVDLATLKGNSEQAIYYLTKLLIQNPYDYRSVCKLIDLLALANPMQEIIKILTDINSIEDRKYQLFLFKVSLSLGMKDLSSYFYTILKDVHSDLDITDRLSYALLQHDEKQFRILIDELFDKATLTFDQLSICATAALVWGSDYYSRLHISQDHELYESYRTFNEVILMNQVKDSQSVYQLLISTYTYQHYEIYDKLVEVYNRSEIINSLANFFYAKHQYEIALKYYSLLLKTNELNATSLENLAYYHLNHHYIEDGLEFLLMAIEIHPEHFQYFSLFLQYCTDEKTKTEFIKRYSTKFTQYLKLPLITQLLKENK